MIDEGTVVGRVLRSSTASYSLGCSPPIPEQEQVIPEFGALLKARGAATRVTYGLVSNVTIEDDAFVRQLVSAGLQDEVYIEDQRQNRQVPIVVDVLVAGYGMDGRIYHRLPPLPPGTLDCIYACNQAEAVRFTARHDWLRLVVAGAGAATDQLLTAAMGLAARARPPDQRASYLIGAGRELARLLALEPGRLEGILAQLKELG